MPTIEFACDCCCNPCWSNPPCCACGCTGFTGVITGSTVHAAWVGAIYNSTAGAFFPDNSDHRLCSSFPKLDFLLSCFCGSGGGVWGYQGKLQFSYPFIGCGSTATALAAPTGHCGDSSGTLVYVFDFSSTGDGIVTVTFTGTGCS